MNQAWRSRGLSSRGDCEACARAVEYGQPPSRGRQGIGPVASSRPFEPYWDGSSRPGRTEHVMTAEPPEPGASKIVLPCPRPMILEYLSLNGTRERIEVRPLLTTRGWHDRRRRSFWPSDEGPALVLSRDDRWI